jgi:hypothetical protein
MPRLEAELTSNADCPWDEFDPDWYVEKNYGTLRDDDQQILTLVRDFFSEVVTGQRRGRGIDLGAGANLYPALTMLPFCTEVTLAERGASNRQWLRDQVTRPTGYGPSWDPFWVELTAARPYQAVRDPRAALRERARIQFGDVFKLGRRQWDLGTMFFVAESLSAREREFKQATHHFVNSLRIGAPFAAAFMKDSRGYTVGSHRFPAVAVNEVDVEHCLSAVAKVSKIVPIRMFTPLREGYGGMILALGTAAGKGTS